ncbi:hypothetical protein [Ktedonospora formicarum]|uniref:Uncharacterized protein n=1 Tax=Ktedonospora formicarum TaxID=2778364 RepID=A0A8J3MTN6_9CHLR|nr:hypothetical protein [Ktedonospora formicarum]GHO44570.1 hypothetical protein KSX_27330 [Ktedonospora formicarum]
MLTECELEVEPHFVWLSPDEGYEDGLLDVKLSAPRKSYSIIKNENHPITKAILDAFIVTLNQDNFYYDTDLLLPSVSPDWREKLRTTIG